MPRARLLAVGLLVTASWVAPAPAGAAPDTTPRFDITTIDGTGCQPNNIKFSTVSENLGGSTHLIRTTVRADNLTFMDEGVDIADDRPWMWSTYPNFTYQVVLDQGTWPLPEDTPVYVQMNVEKPKGTVLSTQRVVFESCNSGTVAYRGRDKCPTIDADTLRGCPIIGRTLTMGYHKKQRELAGALFSAGSPMFHRGRTVSIWKVRPGADRKVATTTTSPQGSFIVRSPGKGRYYATSNAYVFPVTGEALTTTSTTVKIG